MFPAKPNAEIKQCAEGMINDVEALTVELSKGAVSYDHAAVRALVETSHVILLLHKILRELAEINHRERVKAFPHSMLNINK